MRFVHYQIPGIALLSYETAVLRAQNRPIPREGIDAPEQVLFLFACYKQTINALDVSTLRKYFYLLLADVSFVQMSGNCAPCGTSTVQDEPRGAAERAERVSGRDEQEV